MDGQTSLSLARALGPRSPRLMAEAALPAPLAGAALGMQVPGVPRLARGLVLPGPPCGEWSGLVCVGPLQGQVTDQAVPAGWCASPGRSAVGGSPQPCPLGGRALSSVLVRKGLAVTRPGWGRSCQGWLVPPGIRRSQGAPSPSSFQILPQDGPSLNQPLLSCRAPTDHTPLPVPNLSSSGSFL